MRESVKQEIYDIDFEFHDEFASRVCACHEERMRSFASSRSSLYLREDPCI